MSYTPTLEDTPTQNFYQPTLEDTPNITSNNNSSSLSFLSNLKNTTENRLKDVAIGLANMGHGLINAPHNIVNAISPSLASHIPAMAPENYSQDLGMNNPSIWDKALQNIVQYSPYAVAGEGAIAEGAPLMQRAATQGLMGSTYGLTQSNNPQQDVPLGGLSGAVSEAGLNALGSVGSGIINPIKNYLSQFPAKNIFNNISNNLNNLRNLSNSDAFNVAKNNLLQSKQNESQLWNVAHGYAQVADVTPGVNYNDSSYINALNNQANQLKNKLKQNPDAIENQNALKLTNNYINAPHGTFSNAVLHNQALNEDFNNTITPGVSKPFSTVKNSIANLKNNLQENLQNNNLSDTLGSAINNANQATIEHNNNFNNIINSSGKMVPSTLSNFVQNKTDVTGDASHFINDYLPNSGQQGVQNFIKLGKVLGDQDYANNIVKNNIFTNPSDFKSVVKDYDNLSPKQQQFLFNNNEKQILDSLSTAYKNNPNVLTHSVIGDLVQKSLPYVMGGSMMASTIHGQSLLNPLKDLAMLGLGAGGTEIANKLLSSAVGSPWSQRIYMNSLLNKSQLPNEFTSILNRSKNPLVQGNLVPYTIQQ
jgi:hypothetical protein